MRELRFEGLYLLKNSLLPSWHEKNLRRYDTATTHRTHSAARAVAMRERQGAHAPDMRSRNGAAFATSCVITARAISARDRTRYILPCAVICAIEADKAWAPTTMPAPSWRWPTSITGESPVQCRRMWDVTAPGDQASSLRPIYLPSTAVGAREGAAGEIKTAWTCWTERWRSRRTPSTPGSSGSCKRWTRTRASTARTSGASSRATNPRTRRPRRSRAYSRA